MENTLNIYWPFKPYTITQAWGVRNDSYLPLGFDCHNGIDAKPHLIDTSYPVYCPVEGFRVSEVAYYPNGGGKQLGLVSKEKYQVGDKLCYVSILLCHAENIFVKVGDEPALGEMLMIGDNTGFSTGPHTHMGMYRLNDQYGKLDSNEATGSYNPALCFVGDFAADHASLQTLIKSNWRYYSYLLSK